MTLDPSQRRLGGLGMDLNSGILSQINPIDSIDEDVDITQD